MTDKLVLGVGLAHQLEMAFQRNGWTLEQINALVAGGTLGKILGTLDGSSRILPAAVNLGHVPELKLYGEWQNKYHTWNKRYFNLGVDVLQALPLVSDKGRSYAWAEDAENAHRRHPGLLNATALEALLKHPEFIPEEWKSLQSVLFIGTHVINPKGREACLGLKWQHTYWGIDVWECFPQFNNTQHFAVIETRL